MDQSDTLRACFPRGCCIALDLAALAALGLHYATPVQGTGRGYSRTGDLLWVQLDGRKSRLGFSPHVVRYLPEEA
jgi:hypothetical protein